MGHDWNTWLRVASILLSYWPWASGALRCSAPLSEAPSHCLSHDPRSEPLPLRQGMTSQCCQAHPMLHCSVLEASAWLYRRRGVCQSDSTGRLAAAITVRSSSSSAALMWALSPSSRAQGVMWSKPVLAGRQLTLSGAPSQASRRDGRGRQSSA